MKYKAALALIFLAVFTVTAQKDKELRIVAPRDLHDRLAAAGFDVTKLEFEDAGHYDIAEQPDYVARVGEALAQ